MRRHRTTRQPRWRTTTFSPVGFVLSMANAATIAPVVTCQSTTNSVHRFRDVSYDATTVCFLHYQTKVYSSANLCNRSLAVKTLTVSRDARKQVLFTARNGAIIVTLASFIMSSHRTYDERTTRTRQGGLLSHLASRHIA
jgi:hypothetical protein